MSKATHSIGLTGLCIVLLLWVANTLQAADLQVITTGELKGRLDAGEALTLVNALSPIEFAEMAIPGSINIPSSKVTADNSMLPADKAGLLIFYCKGPKCTKSRDAARKAIELGYTNVLVYNEGLPGWGKKGFPMDKKVQYPKVQFDRMTPKEVQAQASSAVLLDIRGKEVLKVGRVPGAVRMPLDDVVEKYSSLPKGKKIIIMDHLGKQVTICGKFLYMNGYTDIAVLDGGVMGWKRAGLPVQ